MALMDALLASFVAQHHEAAGKKILAVLSDSYLN
jgi:hypothetical protein